MLRRATSVPRRFVIVHRTNGMLIKQLLEQPHYLSLSLSLFLVVALNRKTVFHYFEINHFFFILFPQIFSFYTFLRGWEECRRSQEVMKSERTNSTKVVWLEVFPGLSSSLKWGDSELPSPSQLCPELGPGTHFTRERQLNAWPGGNVSLKDLTPDFKQWSWIKIRSFLCHQIKLIYPDS